MTVVTEKGHTGPQISSYYKNNVKKLYPLITLREERDRNFPNKGILCMNRLTRFATQRST